MGAAFRLTATKDAAIVSEPDENDADEFERQLATVLAALADGWTKRARSRLTYPKYRKGTRHWTPQSPDDTRVGNKALDTSKAVDAEQWRADAEQATHPIIKAAAIAAAVALLIDIGFNPPNGESVREFAVRATKRTVEFMVGIIGKFAAAQADLLSSDIAEADQTGAEFDAITGLITDRAERLQTWSEGVGTLVAHGTTNASRDDAAQDAVDAEPDLDVERIWYSRRDERVRPTHVEADGQVRLLGEPFLVGGALLRFPQDPLAPIRETARCRCHTKHRSRRSGRWMPKVTIKAARVRDGDGDGFIYDGTVRQRPVAPVPQTTVTLRLARPNEEAIARGADRINAYRSEAREHRGATLGARDYDAVKTSLAKAFEVEFDTPTGRHVRAPAPVVEVGNVGGVPQYSVVGEINDADTGEALALYEREFMLHPNDQWTVHHAGLSVEESAQGEGIASEFNAHALAWYSVLGVEEVRVSASGTINQTRPERPKPTVDLTSPDADLNDFAASLSEQIQHASKKPMNGGYTWGQQGFDFQGESFRTTLIGRVAEEMQEQEQFAKYLLDSLRGWEYMTPEEQAQFLAIIGLVASNGMTARHSIVDALPDDWWDDPAQRRLLADFLTGLDLDNPPTPWEVNLLGSHLPKFYDKDTGEPTWLGKAVMSRSNWEGFFLLDWLDLYDVKSLRGRQRERILAGLMLASLGVDTDEAGLEGKSIRPLAHAVALGASIQMSRLLDDLPRDADNDGFIYDGTPRQRLAPPRGPQRRLGVRRLGTHRPPARPAKPAWDDSHIIRPSQPLPGSDHPHGDAAVRLQRTLSDDLWDHTGNVGLLDRLVVESDALDRARLAKNRDAESIASSTLVAIIRALLALTRRDGEPVLDEDSASELTKWLDDLIVMVPAGAKARYTTGVKAGTLPRDADNDGFIYDSTPRQRLAPSPAVEAYAKLRRTGTAYLDADQQNLIAVVRRLAKADGLRVTQYRESARGLNSYQARQRHYTLNLTKPGSDLIYAPDAGRPEGDPEPTPEPTVPEGWPVSHQNGTPLNYRGKFPGDAERLYVTEDGYEPGKYGTTGNWEGTPENVVGYIDYSVVGGDVLIWFLTTRRDREKRGIANALVSRLYADHPDKTVEWDELMDDGAEILYKRFRNSHPDQTGNGWVYGAWQTGNPEPVKPIEHLPEAPTLADDPDAKDRADVYLAEQALPNPIQMRAVTDDTAEEIATRVLGEQVTVLRTDVTPGGLEPGRNIFGVWLPGGPVIAAPPDYPLSEFEVYHEIAHLIGHRDGFTGHGETFREAYLRILDDDGKGVLAAALRAEFPKPEWVPDTPGITIENLRKVEGFNEVWEGTVAPNTPPLWRHVGNRRELENAAESDWDSWDASEGGYTARVMEGDTQFAETREQAMAWEPSDASKGYHLLVQADLSGLPVRFIGRTDWTTLGSDLWEPSMSDHGDGTATLHPTTRTGVGVVGKIPLSRIERIETYAAERAEPIGRTFDSWEEYKTWRDVMTGRIDRSALDTLGPSPRDAGAWTPEGGRAERSPDFGKPLGKPIQRPAPGGGYVYIQQIGGTKPGSVVERVICRVKKHDGVWGVFGPYEQSPAMFNAASKAKAVSFALAYANGEEPDSDIWND